MALSNRLSRIMAPSNEITDGNSKIYGKKYEIKIHIVQNWTHEECSALLLFLKPCSFAKIDYPCLMIRTEIFCRGIQPATSGDTPKTTADNS
nr:hypothetical protein [Candidatus Sigynarchaeota archaeon]